MPPDDKTHSVDGIEVFRAGTWHGKEYSTADLDAMVKSFPLVGWTPPLKLGHSEDQRVARDLPAAGWIKNLYRKGQSLFADFVGIPKKVYEVIKHGGYGPVSAEIYHGYVDKEKGIESPSVLKAVAFLGAAVPEVTDLGAFLELYDEQKRPYHVVKMEEGKMESKTDPKAEPKAEQKDLGGNPDLERKVELMEKTVGDLETRLKASIAELTSERMERRKEKIAAKIDALLAAGKIVPAHKEKYAALMNAMPDVTVELLDRDGKPETMHLQGLLESILDASAPIVPLEKLREGTNAGDDGLHDEVVKYCRDNGLNSQTEYSKAMREVNRRRSGIN